MRTSVPCPNCEKAITLDDFEDFSSPFTLKCPYCKAKLKETKVTPCFNPSSSNLPRTGSLFLNYCTF